MKHPVYSSLNMRLKVGPCDRQFFFMALMLGPMVALNLKTVLGGIWVFCAFYFVGCYIGTKDPRWLANINYAGKQKAYYDPSK